MAFSFVSAVPKLDTANPDHIFKASDVPLPAVGRKFTPTQLNKVSSTESRAERSEANNVAKKSLRELKWTDEHNKELMRRVSSYETSCEGPARVLLLGPVGSGKSSFISSVQSIFSGRVLNRAMVGLSAAGFTKKLQTFTIQGKEWDRPTALTLCDVMGLGEGEGTGISFYDIMAVIKGHAPEGHKFSASAPLVPGIPGYVPGPGLADRVHCVLFVLDASQLSSYCRGLRGTVRKLRDHISDLGVHQLTLLTHIDKVCLLTAADLKNVYKSPTIQMLMAKAGEMLGMSVSSIMPVMNYSTQLELDGDTDTLLLSAVDLVLEYTDLYLQDHGQEEPKKPVPLPTGFSTASAAGCREAPGGGGDRGPRAPAGRGWFASGSV